MRTYIKKVYCLKTIRKYAYGLNAAILLIAISTPISLNAQNAVPARTGYDCLRSIHAAFTHLGQGENPVFSAQTDLPNETGVASPNRVIAVPSTTDRTITVFQENGNGFTIREIPIPLSEDAVRTYRDGPREISFFAVPLVAHPRNLHAPAASGVSIPRCLDPNEWLLIKQVTQSRAPRIQFVVHHWRNRSHGEMIATISGNRIELQGLSANPGSCGRTYSQPLHGLNATPEDDGYLGFLLAAQRIDRRPDSGASSAQGFSSAVRNVALDGITRIQAALLQRATQRNESAGQPTPDYQSAGFTTARQALTPGAPGSITAHCGADRQVAQAAARLFNNSRLQSLLATIQTAGPVAAPGEAQTASSETPPSSPSPVGQGANR